MAPVLRGAQPTLSRRCRAADGLDGCADAAVGAANKTDGRASSASACKRQGSAPWSAARKVIARADTIPLCSRAGRCTDTGDGSARRFTLSLANEALRPAGRIARSIATGHTQWAFGNVLRGGKPGTAANQLKSDDSKDAQHPSPGGARPRLAECSGKG